jgi:hypothetical protein
MNPRTTPLTCNSEEVDACMQADLVKTYRTIFALREYDLPLTQASFDAIFGSKIAFFAGDTSQRERGISSNTTLTNAVDMPFLVRCISIYVSVEPIGFTAAGEAIAAPTSPNTPVPYFDGILTVPGPLQFVNNVQTGISQPAWLEWGIPTWKAAHAFMQAYRLQMLLGGRLELFNELNADVGNMDSHSPWVGFSNSLSELPQFVQHVNRRQHEIAGGSAAPAVIFLPATAQQVVLPGQTQTTTNTIGVPTPLVQASWGGPKQEGLFCGCYPVRGILLVPGMPINLNMIRDDGDSIYYAALNDALVQATNVTYDVNFSGDVVVAGNTIASTKFTEFKGGKLRIGITMRGFELTPRAAVQWYGTYGGSFGQLYAVQASQSVMMEYALGLGITQLSDVPAWVAGHADQDLANQGQDQQLATRVGWARVFRHLTVDDASPPGAPRAIGVVIGPPLKKVTSC